jgi:hypothetical protein
MDTLLPELVVIIASIDLQVWQTLCCTSREFSKLLPWEECEKILFVKTESTSATTWRYRGSLHRFGDRPAMITRTAVYWFRHGLEHRIGGPAIMRIDGSRTWCRRGRNHRDDDYPAVIGADGTRVWMRNGLPYRRYGPHAIEAEGDCTWYVLPLTDKHNISRRNASRL